jgi:xanthosine utilization system XapX-like protein
VLGLLSCWWPMRATMGSATALWRTSNAMWSRSDKVPVVGHPLLGARLEPRTCAKSLFACALSLGSSSSIGFLVSSALWALVRMRMPAGDGVALLAVVQLCWSGAVTGTALLCMDVVDVAVAPFKARLVTSLDDVVGGRASLFNVASLGAQGSPHAGSCSTMARRSPHAPHRRLLASLTKVHFEQDQHSDSALLSSPLHDGATIESLGLATIVVLRRAVRWRRWGVSTVSLLVSVIANVVWAALSDAASSRLLHDTTVRVSSLSSVSFRVFGARDSAEEGARGDTSQWSRLRESGLAADECLVRLVFMITLEINNDIRCLLQRRNRALDVVVSTNIDGAGTAGGEWQATARIYIRVPMNNLS